MPIKLVVDKDQLIKLSIIVITKVYNMPREEVIIEVNTGGTSTRGGSK